MQEKSSQLLSRQLEETGNSCHQEWMWMERRMHSHVQLPWEITRVARQHSHMRTSDEEIT